MGSEYMGPLHDPQTQQSDSAQRPVSTSGTPDGTRDDPEVTQRLRRDAVEQQSYDEPVYREHVSGTLYAHPTDAPNFRPIYPPYVAPQAQNVPPQQGAQVQGGQGPTAQTAGGQQPLQPGQPYNGYYQPYPGYGMGGASPYPGYPTPYGYPPPYPWPPKPKRDGYLFGVSIASFVCTILVSLAGLGCLVILLILLAFSDRFGSLKPDQLFSGVVQFTAFVVAGLVGGGYGLYHSIRALFLQRPSKDFRLPQFWIFLLAYVVVIGIALFLRSAGLAVANVPFSVFLIGLAGVLPALTILALGIRRIRYPKTIRWPTSWRRFTLSLVSGATLAVVLALVLELVLSAATAQALHITDIRLDDPSAPLPKGGVELGFLFLLIAVIAPIVEEAVKPLAVILLIPRIRSAAEAFVLGLASGIGFDLVETSGYIAMGYRDWVDVAIQRSSAGLLHGFGAAMFAMGCYFISHPRSAGRLNHVKAAWGCWLYAILQHAIWNGSSFLQALPAPVGPYLESGEISLGIVSFPSFLLVYVVFTVLMLIFFLYVTKWLRPKSRAAVSERDAQVQPMGTVSQAIPASH